MKKLKLYAAIFSLTAFTLVGCQKKDDSQELLIEYLQEDNEELEKRVEALEQELENAKNNQTSNNQETTIEEEESQWVEREFSDNSKNNEDEELAYSEFTDLIIHAEDIFTLSGEDIDSITISTDTTKQLLNKLTNIDDIHFSFTETNCFELLTYLPNPEKVTSLTVSESNDYKMTDADLEAVCILQNLEILRLGSVDKITNIEPLRKLTKLTHLMLCSADELEDITPLANLTNLEDLSLYLNNISDISALSNLNQLRSLEIYDNNISDFSPLENLPNLEYLSINGNNLPNEELDEIEKKYTKKH